MTFHGGAVIRGWGNKDVVEAFFWGDKWKTDADHQTLALALFGFFNGIGAQIKGPLSEYVNIDGVTWGGDNFFADQVGTLGLKPNITDSDITGFLFNALLDFGTINPGTIFFVFLPSGVTVTSDQGKVSCVDMCGYHHYYRHG